MLPTLKGVFPKPKTQYKRDFLLENKLNVKDIQKNSSRLQLEKKLHEEQLKQAEYRRRQRLRHKSLDARAWPTSKTRARSCCSCDCGKTEASYGPESAVVKKIETCTREVQTEDIFDEDFLFEALQKCSSGDIQDEELDQQLPLLETDTNSKKVPDHHAEPDFNFDNLVIDTDRIPPTASTLKRSSKRTPRKLHELGNRQDICLPKYLEKQKREKEILKQKELLRDPNCPFGFEPVSEEDRVKTLNKAQKKFQDLIMELNRMPMTTETLRLRSRKVEIERKLIELENEIRIFSKPRVYVKINGLL